MSADSKTVTNQDAQQKKVTVSSCDGKFPKNEVIIEYTGLMVTSSIGPIVKEVADALAELQKKAGTAPA